MKFYLEDPDTYLDELIARPIQEVVSDVFFASMSLYLVHVTFLLGSLVGAILGMAMYGLYGWSFLTNLRKCSNGHAIKISG